MIFRTYAQATFLAVVSAGMLTGCGALNFVKGAQVSAYAQNGDQYAQLGINLNTSTLQFPTITIPIVDPSNPAKTDGSVGLVTSATGTELEFTVDLSALVNLPVAGQTALLPNGASLPIANYSAASLLTFKVGSSDIYVDINTATNQAMLGAALVISEFNVNTTTDLFIPFSVSGVTGTAGVFTGAQAGESGFAVFADVSSTLATLSALSTTVGSVNALHALSLNGPTVSRLNIKVPVSSSISTAASPYSFVGSTPASSDMNKLKGMLNTLNKNRTPLHVQ